MSRFGSAVDVAQVSAPATPVAGRSFLYFKSDGLPYSKGPDGVEHTLVTAVPTYASVAKWGTE